MVYLVARPRLSMVPKEECTKTPDNEASSATSDALTMDFFGGWLVSFLVLEALLFVYALYSIFHLLFKSEDVWLVHMGTKIFFFTITFFSLICLLPLCLGMRS